jgi:RimJ/RimL family protein N-acetyltransferase
VSGQRPIEIDLPAALSGPRVVVRPYDEPDTHALWEAVDESRDRLGEWMPWASEYHSVADAAVSIRQMRAKWLLREDLIVGIFDRQSGRLLGGSGLHRIDWHIRKFEIGYWARDSAVGRGYVSEAVQVLTRFAFDHLDAARVEIRMDVRNTRSRAVPERLGFTYEGCMRRALPDGTGQPGDIALFSLIREEFEALRWRHPDLASTPASSSPDVE